MLHGAEFLCPPTLLSNTALTKVFILWMVTINQYMDISHRAETDSPLNTIFERSWVAVHVSLQTARARLELALPAFRTEPCRSVTTVSSITRVSSLSGSWTPGLHSLFPATFKNQYISAKSTWLNPQSLSFGVLPSWGGWECRVPLEESTHLNSEDTTWEP